MKDYHINLFYSDEDEGYIADIPDLKHCSACGDQREPHRLSFFAENRVPIGTQP